jgi:hypothetical protein
MPEMSYHFLSEHPRKKPGPKPADPENLKCRVLMKNGKWLVDPAERPALPEPPKDSKPDRRPPVVCYGWPES